MFYRTGTAVKTTYKEDIQECKHRVDAWWNHEIIDRAVVQIRVSPEPGSEDDSNLPEMSPQDAEAWFMEPGLVIQRLKRELSNTYFGGEAFPVMPAVSGRMVAITAAYLGCPLDR